jgi:hypothetical protein
MIISLIGEFSSNTKPQIWLDGDWLNVRGERIKTFQVSLSCACCGVIGKYFIKEKHRAYATNPDETFHLNLYGFRNGVEVEFTSDHKIPISKGGARRGLSNRQTLCYDCNHIKADRMIDLNELRRDVENRLRCKKVSHHVKVKSFDERKESSYEGYEI